MMVLEVHELFNNYYLINLYLISKSGRERIKTPEGKFKGIGVPFEALPAATSLPKASIIIKEWTPWGSPDSVI